MQFTAREWMNELVVFIDPDATVIEALVMMRRRYINSLIVKKSEHNPEYGILTSSDITEKIIANDLNPSGVKVREVMNSPLITIPGSAPLRECAQMMKQHLIHHLPVVDQTGLVIGMLSATDFLVAAEAMANALGGQRA